MGGADYSQMNDSEKLNHIIFLLENDETGHQKRIKTLEQATFGNGGSGRIGLTTQAIIFRWALVCLFALMVGIKHFPKIAAFIGL